MIITGHPSYKAPYMQFLFVRVIFWIYKPTMYLNMPQTIGQICTISALYFSGCDIVAIIIIRG